MDIPADHRVIWQYWETRGRKPAFVDGLLDVARRNAGLPVIQVTPETLPTYLPGLEDGVLGISELAHKADMIRSRLIARHGGIWLDSDAIVLSDLSFLLELLEEADFVGFNDGGRLSEDRPWVRVNCFAARPGSVVMRAWVEAQAARLGKDGYGWEEVGTDLLHPICLAHRHKVRILPFEAISPIPWNRVEHFASSWRSPGRTLDACQVVMLSNNALGRKVPHLQHMTVEEIAATDTYVAHVLRRALDPGYSAPSRMRSLVRSVLHA